MEKDSKLFAPGMGWAIIQQNSSIFLKRLARFGYRTELEELLARYASALDQTNHDVAFLQLWAILERITDTVGAQYEKTVERATWDEPDRQYAKEFLSLMRMHRNRYVHASVSTSEPDQVTYLLKMFVDSHLIALVRNSYRVSSLAEYAAMLSTPVQLHKLEADEQRTATSLRVRRDHIRPKTSEDSASL